MNIEQLSPSYIADQRLVLQLPAGAAEPRAGTSVLVDVDYAGALPEGVELPLILDVRGPSSASTQRRVFRRVAPASVVFTPREGGAHYVVLREAFHNRWWGSLRLDVEGELLDPGS